uniref:CxC5 like cysteine cluster associated with KDZ domain-containing protein n=1 Tax=Mycena chlorophos TaxID=658473 RepID=A0ABQ0LVM1_MYCCL|nr:predicted protein [Mycena chlorophos]
MNSSLIVLASALKASGAQLHALLLFISILNRLWEVVGDASTQQLPPQLTPSVVEVLMLALQLHEPNISEADLQSMWGMLGPHIKSWSGPLLESETDDILRQYAGDGVKKLGVEMLYPPHRHCPFCATKLGKMESTFLRVYTLHRGILPAYDVSLNCAGCQIRFHHSYFVRNPSNLDAKREYYRDPARYIPATQSSYLEDKLCEYFEFSICHAHTSTTNLARIYNAHLGKSNIGMNPNAALLPEISQEAILEGFFMHALFRRLRRTESTLFLPHHTPQEHRLDEVLRSCNKLIAGIGQPYYLHACHDCVKFFEREDGSRYYIRGGTTDGVTIGHPCCGEKDCQGPLLSSKDRYCMAHHVLEGRCAAKGCSADAAEGHITCDIAVHRAEEIALQLKEDAAFRDLSRRSAKCNVPTTQRTADPFPRIFLDHSTPSSTSTKKNSVVLSISRHWTHNDQLFVLCCGVIIARATFYSHEGPSSDFLKKIFPYPWLLPTHIFFDKACLLLKHILSHPVDTFFNTTLIIVDVFHAFQKHDNDFCNKNTIPSLCPELRTTRGGNEVWTLNSSNAEQANVWYGAFQAITREMSEPRYNFFLDEMVTIRNEWIVDELERKGKQPMFRTMESMKADWMASHPEEPYTRVSA